ncbi:MAG: histidine kinase [Acidobacteriota bacterium]
MPRPSNAQLLAAQANSLLVSAGVASGKLHDHVGPLLASAGLRLQLLKLDVPAASEDAAEVTRILEEAIDRVREVIQELKPQPAAQVGLKHALLRFSERTPSLLLSYTADAKVDAETAAALYRAGVGAALEAQEAGASQVRMTVTGKRDISIRVTDNGRPAGRIRALSVLRLLTEAANIKFEVVTGKSTIVSIRYAVRRSTSR